MIGIVVAEALAGIPCPLTVWERQLRKAAGQVAYPGDFIGYWTHRLLFYRAEPWVFYGDLSHVRPGSPGCVRPGAAALAKAQRVQSRRQA